MEVVTQLLANTDINALPEQTELLGRLQRELFQRRALTNWQAPDDAGRCIRAARVLICQLSEHCSALLNCSMYDAPQQQYAVSRCAVIRATLVVLFSICEHCTAYAHVVAMPEASKLASALKQLAVHSVVLSEAGHTLAAMISGQFILSQHCDASSCHDMRMPYGARDSIGIESTSVCNIRGPVPESWSHLAHPLHGHQQQGQEPEGGQPCQHPVVQYPLEAGPRNTDPLHPNGTLDVAQYQSGSMDATDGNCARTAIADTCTGGSQNAASTHVMAARKLQPAVHSTPVGSARNVRTASAQTVHVRLSFDGGTNQWQLAGLESSSVDLLGAVAQHLQQAQILPCEQKNSSLRTAPATCKPTTQRTQQPNSGVVMSSEAGWPAQWSEVGAEHQQDCYSAWPASDPPLKAMQKNSVEAFDQEQRGHEKNPGQGACDVADLHCLKAKSKACARDATAACSGQGFSFRGIHELVRSSLQNIDIHSSFTAGQMQPQAQNQLPDMPQVQPANTGSLKETTSNSAAQVLAHDQEIVMNSDRTQQRDGKSQSQTVTNAWMPLSDALEVKGSCVHDSVRLSVDSAEMACGGEQLPKDPAAPHVPQASSRNYEPHAFHSPSAMSRPRTALQKSTLVGTSCISESSALNEYNRAKKFGPRVLSCSPAVSPNRTSLRSGNHDEHAFKPVKQSPPACFRSISSPCHQRPSACKGTGPAVSCPFNYSQQHRSTNAKLLSSADQHTNSWMGRSWEKEDTVRPGRRCQNSQHWISSSESPVSGLDIWRCSALQEELQQVEKTLRASRRSRCHENLAAAHDVATSLGDGPKRARGTMSSILERMRQGSLQRSPRKNRRKCRSQDRHDTRERQKAECTFEKGVVALRDSSRRRLSPGSRPPLDRRREGVNWTGCSKGTMDKARHLAQEGEHKKKGNARVRWQNETRDSSKRTLKRKENRSVGATNRSVSAGCVPQTRSSILRERNSHLHRMEEKMQELNRMDDILKEKHWH